MRGGGEVAACHIGLRGNSSDKFSGPRKILPSKGKKSGAHERITSRGGRSTPRAGSAQRASRREPQDPVPPIARAHGHTTREPFSALAAPSSRSPANPRPPRHPSAAGRGTSALLEAVRPALASPAGGVLDPRLHSKGHPPRSGATTSPDPDAARRDARLLEAQSFTERFHQMPTTVRDSIRDRLVGAYVQHH